MKIDQTMQHTLCEGLTVRLSKIDPEDTFFTVGEFLDHCLNNLFSDYDGFGEFVISLNGQEYEILDLQFSIDEDEVTYKGDFIGSIFYICSMFNIKKIVWYNK